MAATVIDQQVTTRVAVVFYVKENQDSPYQGLLTFTPEEFAALKPDALEAQQQAQFQAWKIVRDTPPILPTVDDKVAMIVDMKRQKVSLDQQIADLAADPAVAAKLPPDPKAQAVPVDAIAVK